MIIAGIKTIEHRSWRTSHRGRLWIRSGLEINPDAPVLPDLAVPHSAIIGHVTLLGVVAGDGCWEWLLAEPVPLAVPLPCRGHLWLWRPPGELIV